MATIRSSRAPSSLNDDKMPSKEGPNSSSHPICNFDDVLSHPSFQGYDVTINDNVLVRSSLKKRNKGSTPCPPSCNISQSEIVLTRYTPLELFMVAINILLSIFIILLINKFAILVNSIFNHRS